MELHVCRLLSFGVGEVRSKGMGKGEGSFPRLEKQGKQRAGRDHKYRY